MASARAQLWRDVRAFLRAGGARARAYLVGKRAAARSHRCMRARAASTGAETRTMRAHRDGAVNHDDGRAIHDMYRSRSHF